MPALIGTCWAENVWHEDVWGENVWGQAVEAAPQGGRSKKRRKRKKVFVGERVFWSDQHVEIGRAILELRRQREAERAKKVESKAQPKRQVAEFTFPDLPKGGLVIPDDYDEDDIECLLLCS